MNRIFGKLLVTLILLSAVVVTTGGTAKAAPVAWTISEHDEQASRPIGDLSGEPDVGQTSPTSAGRVQGKSALVGESRFDSLLRMTVWLWKARHGLTGF